MIEEKRQIVEATSNDIEFKRNDIKEIDVESLDSRRSKVKEIKSLIKKGLISNSDVEWLQKRVYDNRWMQLEMISMLDDIKGNPNLTLGQKLKFLEVYSNIYGKLHGDKIKLDVKADISVERFKTLFTTNDTDEQKPV